MKSKINIKNDELEWQEKKQEELLVIILASLCIGLVLFINDLFKILNVL